MADVPTPTMEVVDGIARLAARHGRLFVVVGVFDGLHRGHHYLLRHLRAEAAARDARATVVTFDHHPDEILTGAAPPLLCDPEERLELLARAGVEVTVVQPFDVTLRMTPFEAFVRSIAERVDLAGFLMTPDAAFGHDRGGTPETVAALGRTLGYEVVVIPPLDVDGRHVRSADIRAAIAAGDLGEAAHLLGRDVSVTGTARAIDGATQLTFGLPVALPPAGRYPARAALGGSRSEHDVTLEIDDGAAAIRPPIRDSTGRRVRVRLPVRARAATIRRS